jgi:hypothetical protein
VKKPTYEIEDQLLLHCFHDIIINYHRTLLFVARTVVVISTCTIPESASMCMHQKVAESRKSELYDIESGSYVSAERT